jgi:hypothetical protein
MLKNAYDASPLSVSREALLESAARFLRRLAGDDALVPVDGMTSADWGAPDLAFVKRGTGGITAAMVHCQGDFAGFALRAAAYYCWLKECVRFSETILGRTIGLNIYIVSHDVPSADSYLLKALSAISGLFFIKYQVLDIEEQRIPVVRFHLLEMSPSTKDGSNGNRGLEAAVAAAARDGQPLSECALSSQEIEEFNLLKERYL